MSHFWGMLAYVYALTLTPLFYEIYQRRKYRWPCFEHNLMSQEESERLLRILNASQNS
jgi:hypothetical protein